MAPGSPPNPPPNPPAAPNAASLAVKFGGNVGGRPRKDGLVPGSPEALEADRAKARERMRRKRALEKTAAVLAQTQSAAPDAPPGLPPAPGDSPAPAPGGPGVPWDPGLVKPIFEQLIPACEKYAQGRLVAKAGKLAAPPELIREIERDAAWPAPAKAALVSAGPICAAKWLNQSGIGAENAPEVILGTALATLVAHHLALSAKLDRLIAAQAPPPKPAPPPTPPKDAPQA